MDSKPILKILVLNLMPDKAKTQANLNVFFKKSSYQILPTFCYPATHHFKNQKSMVDIAGYQSFPEIQDQYFDGLIITGAAVEKLAFEKVDYWLELCQIYSWSQVHCSRVLSLCWAAQAGMYILGQIKKYPVKNKIFGIYAIDFQQTHPLFKKLNRTMQLPFSRYTTNCSLDFSKSDLRILAGSPQVGPAICETSDQQQLFITGHPEYQLTMLADEYRRDLKLGKQIIPPKNYFLDSQNQQIKGQWLADCRQLFANWFDLLVKVRA
ncbi:homoserine O-acetyltransferase/O-succinyltransferase family protein [Liquorilactobacillus sicerae]|uniref:homoserine O-acetyltransferase/O-succinyltransferase family protein n=1 Tax=Liquorilactobacillus sicerae TaxID=1416943 RepID=UPI0024812DDB|nr:homoserine O-succinyltransferase [Liquorilactobacillus sicerae]